MVGRGMHGCHCEGGIGPRCDKMEVGWVGDVAREIGALEHVVEWEVGSSLRNSPCWEFGRRLYEDNTLTEKKIEYCNGQHAYLPRTENYVNCRSIQESKRGQTNTEKKKRIATLVFLKAS